MRRISVWMLATVLLITVAGTEAGIIWNKADIVRAETLAEEESITFSGVVRSVSFSSEDYCRLTVDTKRNGRVMVGVYEAEEAMKLLPGKTVEITAEPALPETSDNPGVFDYAKYLKSQGIYLTASCSRRAVKEGGLCRNPFKGIIIFKAAEFRYEFMKRMEKTAGRDTAALFAGMLFGDKASLSEETYENFQKNGTAHILSVSGLHVAIIYGLIAGLLGKRRGSIRGAVISAVALAGMSVLASFSVSVIRAVIMIYLKIAADLLKRPYDLISAACITATGFLVINPYVIYSTGFILSFSAVISLAVIGGGMGRMIKNPGPVMQLFMPVISIQLGMIPLTAYFFNYFSLAAFVSNIPVIFLSGIMIPLGLIAAGLFLAGTAGALFFDGAGAVCGFMAGMLEFFNDFTGAYGHLAFIIESPGPMLMAAYYIVCFLLFSEIMSIYPVNSGAAAVYIITLAAVFGGLWLEEGRQPEVVFLDVGQGDCIHIRTPDGKNYLVDGGGSVNSDYDVGTEIIEPYLLKNGVSHLDGVIISHMDADHYKGISTLNEAFVIDRLYISGGYRYEEEELKRLLNIDDNETLIEYMYLGDRAELGNEVCFDVLWPDTDTPLSFNSDSSNDNPGFNESCLVIKLNYRGTEILLPGDIGEEQEQHANESWSCDIVKVPHHGSKYSSSEVFVEETGASAAVIEVGKNNFGHPSQSVIERYEESGIMVFRTDRDGAVCVNIDSSGYKIRSWK